MTVMSDRELVARCPLSIKYDSGSCCDGYCLNGKSPSATAQHDIIRSWVYHNVGCDYDHNPSVDDDQFDELLAALNATGRLRTEATDDSAGAAAKAYYARTVEAPAFYRSDLTVRTWDMLDDADRAMRTSDMKAVSGIIVEAVEQRVRSGLAKQMREAAEANRKLGNVDAAGIFDDIAKDLEAPHVG